MEKVAKKEKRKSATQRKGGQDVVQAKGKNSDTEIRSGKQAREGKKTNLNAPLYRCTLLFIHDTF